MHLCVCAESVPPAAARKERQQAHEVANALGKQSSSPDLCSSLLCRVSAVSSSLQGEAARTSGVSLPSAQAPAAAASPFSGAAMRPSGASVSMRGSNVSSIGRNSSEASKVSMPSTQAVLAAASTLQCSSHTPLRGYHRGA